MAEKNTEPKADCLKNFAQAGERLKSPPVPTQATLRKSYTPRDDTCNIVNTSDPPIGDIAHKAGDAPNPPLHANVLQKYDLQSLARAGTDSTYEDADASQQGKRQVLTRRKDRELK